MNIKMKKQKVAVGLDIGSSKICAVASVFGGECDFRVLAQVTGDSAGMSRGMVTDISEATGSVAAAMNKLRSKLPDTSVREVYVNISGTDLRGAVSRGMVPISMRGREITRADMARCAMAAGTIHMPIDRDVIARITHRFSVDDKPWIGDPEGLYASRLSCEVFVISADSNHIQDITKCVNSAGCDVKEIVLTSLANRTGLLADSDMSGEIAIMDMGCSLTDIALFSNGVMRDVSVLAFGGSDIKSAYDLDDGLGSAIKEIREKLGIGSERGPSRIVLTGGVAFRDGFIEFLESRLSVPVEMGVVRDLRGDVSAVDAIRLSTAIGLTRYAFEKYQSRLREGKIVRRLSEKVVDIFNNYF